MKTQKQDLQSDVKYYGQFKNGEAEYKYIQYVYYCLAEESPGCILPDRDLEYYKTTAHKFGAAGYRAIQKLLMLMDIMDGRPCFGSWIKSTFTDNGKDWLEWSETKPEESTRWNGEA